MFTENRIKKDKDSLKLAKAIGGKRFSTVSEIDENGDSHIVGHGGSVTVSGREVVIISNGHETFRSTKNSFRAAELMSGNGVRLSGIDRDGNKHNILAIYTKL